MLTEMLTSIAVENLTCTPRSVAPPVIRNAGPDSQSGAATATPELTTRPASTRPKPRNLPQWRVLLHNDDVNEFLYVIDTVIELIRVRRQDATLRVIEAHQSGLALLTTTHREHAELLQEQFMSKKLIVTLEQQD